MSVFTQDHARPNGRAADKNTVIVKATYPIGRRGRFAMSSIFACEWCSSRRRMDHSSLGREAAENGMVTCRLMYKIDDWKQKVIR